MTNHKRTLKKRIRALMNSCVLFTILLFTVFIMALAALFLNIESNYLCTYYSETIAQNISSSYFLKEMNISNLLEFDQNSQQAKDYFASLDKLSDVSSGKILGHLIPNQTNNTVPSMEPATNTNLKIMNVKNMINIRIAISNKEVYYRETDISDLLGTEKNSSTHKNTLANYLFKYFNIFKQSPIYDSFGNQLGTVTVSVNTNFVMYIFSLIIIAIIFFSIIVIIFNRIIINIITTPITIPLKQLEANINAVADGEFDNIMNSKVIVKKPLREIESLADSTNRIIEKMRDYNETLTAQNEELEAQNEELSNSKEQIEDQQALLVQSENMASIGQLTAAITHEINTPLGAINSNSQIFDMFINLLSENQTIQNDPELRDLINQMRETNEVSIMACKRVTDIIKSLKTFTRLDQAEFQETNIQESIKSVLILSSNLWKKNITIHEEYGELNTIRCYSGLLNQVIMNLVVNAIQSIQNKGDLFIKTYSDDKNMYISVRDTGSGIPEENLNKIFDFGFTTKGTGIGMGMGLAISYNIIQKHHGDIAVNSELGKGTEFIISIPLSL